MKPITDPESCLRWLASVGRLAAKQRSSSKDHAAKIAASGLQLWCDWDVAAENELLWGPSLRGGLSPIHTVACRHPTAEAGLAGAGRQNFLSLLDLFSCVCLCVGVPVCPRRRVHVLTRNNAASNVHWPCSDFLALPIARALCAHAPFLPEPHADGKGLVDLHRRRIQDKSTPYWYVHLVDDSHRCDLQSACGPTSATAVVTSAVASC